MAFKMGKNVYLLLLTLGLLFTGVYSVSVSSSPTRIVNGLLSNAISVLMKWFWSLKDTTKTAMTGRPMMKFESGYNVETVFDGSKLGIEPHSVEVLSDGDLLILDSVNSNLYKISSSLSLYSRPKLVSGSADGYTGHIDGKLREARMNHPKGFTVDDRGNVYIADTDNMAIRKISETGVTTIAGGKRGRSGGHVDGPSEDAKFSNDFDVVYLGSSCSLLVIDRGNKAIREIQLNFDDCAYQYGSDFPLGFVVLIAAGCFGYLLALLQRGIGSRNDESVSPNAYQKPLKSFTRPPLIPNDDEQEKQEEGFLGSIARLIAQTGESAAEILGGVFPGFKKQQLNHHHHQYQQQSQYSNSWPVQESYVIREEDEPPTIEARTPTPRKTYAFMSKDSEKMQKLKKSKALYSGWEYDAQQQETKKQQHQSQYYSSEPKTYYEQDSENTGEIVFGAVQEQEKRRGNVVKKSKALYSGWEYDAQLQETKKQQHQSQYYSLEPKTYYEQDSENTGEIVFGAVQEQEKRRGNVVIKPLDHGFNVYGRKSVRSRVGNGDGR